MKKSIIILLSFLIVGGAFAQKAPTTKLISSSEEQIVVQVDLNGFNLDKVQTPQGVQYIVNVPKTGSILEAGAPDLPMLPIPAIIGDRAEMTVNVIDAQYTDYANMEIAPSKGNLSRQIDPANVPYTYGEMYQQNAYWPATQVYLEKPYILRDLRGQNIMVRPFAYNPVTKTLRVYTSMTITMTKVSDNGENQKASRKSNTIKVDPEQKAHYSRRFINFGETSAKYIFDEDFGELLIICADPYMENLQPLVEWKNLSGRPTTLVSLSTAGGNNIENVKNYVSTFYNDPNHNLEYVLLVGEYNDLTPKNYGGGSGGTVYSDNYIGKLEGNDDYLEVLVGRLSVANAADADVQVNKIIYYERDVQAGIAWCDKGLGIGHMTDGTGSVTGHYNEADFQHIHFISDTLLHYTYSQITEHHGGSGGTASTSTISATINAGISIINYCNHGSETTWGVASYSTSNVAALTNDYMLPIVWSVACLNGKFDVGTCFGESWLRAHNNSTNAPTGAVGGMFSFVSQPWQPPMYGQDEMVDILTEWRSVDQFNHTFGGASLNGSMYVLDMAPGDSYQTFNSWLLFGDPSMMLRTANPTEMTVNANPSVLMLGMNELTVNADVAYGIATLSMNGELIASGKVINGQCMLTFPALQNVGTANLVIIGYNKVTYMGTIDIVPAEGAYITMNEYVMSAEQANYGETIDMSIDIKNVGIETVENLTATLTTSSEYVEIISDESTATDLNPDEIVTLEGFQFSVAENVPDKTDATFTLTVTDGTDTWGSTFIIKLHAPVVEFESMTKTDSIIAFTFKNSGSAPFHGGVLNLTSCSPDLVFAPSNITFEDTVESGQNITFETNYTFSESVEPGTTFEAAYSFTTGLFNIEEIFVLSYGAIMENFESGTFGNDWSFSSLYPWTIVNGGTKGTKCAKSANSSVSNSESYMQLTVNVLAAGNLTFMYKVSSEMSSTGTMYDKLTFYMDGATIQSWAGTSMTEFAQFVQPVTTGTHTFKWSYTKDSSVNSGEDCAWIDDIIFPPTSVITFLETVTNLNATVNDTEVTLTWEESSEAAGYLIKRDGEEIARVTETTFTEFVPYGNYLYSVIATSEDGSLSAPATISVSVVDYTGVEENNTSFEVYPNPVHNTLYINTNVEFTYSLYNSMGQEMAKGNAQGSHRIDVNNLTNGVYFLRITSGNQTNVQKIVVE